MNRLLTFLDLTRFFFRVVWRKWHKELPYRVSFTGALSCCQLLWRQRF